MMESKDHKLQVTPFNELKFQGPFTSVVTSHLILRNNGDKPIIFKVKTNVPKMYCVRPNSGVIESNKERDVSVMLQPFDCDDPNNYRIHKFLIQSTTVADVAKLGNLDQLFRTLDKNQINETKLRCILDDKMASMKTDVLVNKTIFNDQLCNKISIAIKKSNIFAHINPSDLIRKRFSKTHLNSIEDVTANKKSKMDELLSVNINNNDNNSCKENLSQNSCNLSLHEFLPKPDTLFSQSTPNSKPISIKSECVVKENCGFQQGKVSGDQNRAGESVDKVEVRPKPKIFTIQGAIASKNNKLDTNSDKSPKIEVNREKHNKDLSNLVTSLLPLPTQLFGKHSILTALDGGNYSDFLKYLKEGINIENEISTKDLKEIIDLMMQKKASSLIPQFLSCLLKATDYIDCLIDSFFEYKSIFEKYQSDFLHCVSSMVDFKSDSSINSFIKICAQTNCWDRMWPILSKNKPDHIIPENYFDSCMTIFNKLENKEFPFKHETLMSIILYIKRNMQPKKSVYMADIWFYCMYNDINIKDINSVMEFEAQQNIEAIIEKLNNMNDPSFIFGMKLLTKNWNLIYNFEYCEWFAKLISEKSDIKKCLFAIKDSIHSLNRNMKQDIFDNFYLLGIRVMSYLNKKSLFTCSKNVYETFLKNFFADIKRTLLKVNDKFKLKWTMVECLVSSAEYEKALNVIKEFEVLKDLEVTSLDYNRVKEILPNLVWHLINSSELLPVIVLFEQVVSIFIFNENSDSAYTKNCNEIFNLIVVKAYESNNVDVVKKIISLLDLILSANIDFEISKESLRYLSVAAVRTNIPFKELLDFVDLCFNFKIFGKIETTEDGFGSFVNAGSHLTYEEIVLLVTWMCRHVKINLVKTAQNQGSSIRENIMKVCSIQFVLHSSRIQDLFSKEMRVDLSLKEFLARFTEALNNPKYLKHPIKFSTSDETNNYGLKISCDNRIVYNTIYYSDI